MLSDEDSVERSSSANPTNKDRVYLLRCWQEGPNWRFSAQQVGPQRERRGFVDLDQMTAWLQRELDDQSPGR